MSHSRDDALSGLLAQAVQELLDAPGAGAPPADLNALVLRELSRTDGSADSAACASMHSVPQHNERRRMSLLLKYSLAAALLVAVGAVGWVGLTGGTTAVYGALAERLETLQSMVYRVQWIRDSELVNFNPGDGDKVIYVAPSHYRIERSDGSALVIDTAARQAVELRPATKQALVMSGQLAGDMAAISQGPTPLLDTLRKHFRTGPKLPEGVEDLGTKLVGRVPAHGLRSTIQGEVVEAWLDPATSLPVEVRIRLDVPAQLSGLAGSATRMWRIMSAFEFDAAVESSLIRVEVPAGYAALQAPDVRIPQNTAAPSLTDLIDALRLCAKHNDATFPATLSLNRQSDSCMAIMARFADTQEEVWTSGTDAEKQAVAQAVAEFGAATGRMTSFLFSLRPESDFHYAGKGVKLDAPDRPILWFTPKGDGQYQVVYADLSVKELPASALPQLPEAKRIESKSTTVIRLTSPRIVLPQSAVRDFAALADARKSGKQKELRFLELQLMPEFINGNAPPISKKDGKASKLEFLTEFSKLEGLRVDDLVLTDQDLDVIGGCLNLQKLSLSGVRILEASGATHRLRGEELQRLGRLTNLEALDLSQADFQGGLKHLSGLPALHTLILNSFEHLNDASVGELKLLPRLETLVLAPVYGTNPQTTVTDQGLASLTDLPSLRTLYIGYHGKWTAPVDKLQALLPGVDVRYGFQEETSDETGFRPAPPIRP